MNPQWTPIDHLSDSALRKLARDSRNMRAEAARRELARREQEVA